MRLLLTILLHGVSIITIAQVKFGLNAGINLTNLSFRPYYAATGNHGMLISRFNAGMQTEIPLSDDDDWFLITGLHYSGKGTKYGINSRSDKRDSITVHLNYAELPVNVIYKFPSENEKRMAAGAGLYISYGFKGKRLYKNSPALTGKNLHGPDKPYKRIDAGVNIFGLYEVNRKWGLKAGYSKSLFKINRYDGKEFNNVFGVSFFWWLYNTRPISGTPRF